MSLNLTQSDFDFIGCSMTRSCMINGCWAMDQTGLWQWLRHFEVDPSRGFMFSNDPELNVIVNMMERDGAPCCQSHSGASFGFTMRNLHYIAQHGFEAYKELYLETQRLREQERQQQTCGGNE